MNWAKVTFYNLVTNEVIYNLRDGGQFEFIPSKGNFMNISGTMYEVCKIVHNYFDADQCVIEQGIDIYLREL